MNRRQLLAGLAALPVAGVAAVLATRETFKHPALGMGFAPAPAYEFRNDSNYGWWSPAAYKIEIVGGGGGGGVRVRPISHEEMYIA